MLSAWRSKFESVEKCESRWSKVYAHMYTCDTIMLTFVFTRWWLNGKLVSLVWNNEETIFIM